MWRELKRNCPGGTRVWQNFDKTMEMDLLKHRTGSAEMAEPLTISSSVLDLILLGSRVVVARVEVDRLWFWSVVRHRGSSCRRSSWSSVRWWGGTRVVMVVRWSMVVLVRWSRCAWTVECCPGWTLGSWRSGRGERLVVDWVVSLRIKVKHAGEAGWRLVGWKNGLEGHAKANCLIGKVKARGNKESEKGKRKWGLLAFSTAWWLSSCACGDD